MGYRASLQESGLKALLMTLIGPTMEPWRNCMKIVLIGAGSAQFGFGTLGDIFQSKKLAGSEICLVDIDEKALDHVTQVAREVCPGYFP